MSESLNAVAAALTNDSAGPPSPVRKTVAVCAVQQLDLTQTEKICALQLIRSDTAFADTLLAIDDTEFRVDFIRAELHSLNL